LKLKVKIIFTISTTLTLGFQPLAHAQADATGAGLHRGTSRFQVKAGPADTNSPIKEPAGLTYLLKGAWMESTRDNDTWIAFGKQKPFQNKSDFPLTITISPVDGYEFRDASGIVDGAQVAYAYASAMTFSVPPNSSYGFNVKGPHSISATVAVREPIVTQFGLPSAQQFSNPLPTGAYLGCSEYWASGWRNVDDTKSVWEQSFLSKNSYYAAGPWTDGSSNPALQDQNGRVLGPDRPGSMCEVIGKLDKPGIP
jgi:hypothetical protein